MSGVTRALSLTLAVCGLVFALDQAAKGLINETVSRGEEVQVLPFLAFENTRNSGIAFGVGGEVSPLLIAATVVALVLVLGYLALHADRPLIWLPAGLLLGGALGNLADRVREGAVIDFIDLPLWPTFNLADVAITVGVVTLLLVGERRSP